VSGAGSGGQENNRRDSGYLEVAPTVTKGWPPLRASCDILLRVALSSTPYAIRVTGAKGTQCGYLEVAPTDTKR